MNKHGKALATQTEQTSKYNKNHRGGAGLLHSAAHRWPDVPCITTQHIGLKRKSKIILNTHRQRLVNSEMLCHSGHGICILVLKPCHLLQWPLVPLHLLPTYWETYSQASLKTESLFTSLIFRNTTSSILQEKT